MLKASLVFCESANKHSELPTTANCISSYQQMFSHVHKNETSGLIEFNGIVNTVDKMDEQLSQGSEHHGISL